MIKKIKYCTYLFNNDRRPSTLNLTREYKQVHPAYISFIISAFMHLLRHLQVNIPKIFKHIAFSYISWPFMPPYLNNSRNNAYKVSIPPRLNMVKPLRLLLRITASELFSQLPRYIKNEKAGGSVIMVYNLRKIIYDLL